MIGSIYEACLDYTYSNDDERADVLYDHIKTNFLDIHKLPKLKFSDFNIKNIEFCDINDYIYNTAYHTYLSTYNSEDFLGYQFKKINSFLPSIYKIGNFKSIDFINDFITQCKIPNTSYLRTFKQNQDNTIIAPTLITLQKDLLLYFIESDELIIFYNTKYEKDKDSILYKFLSLIKNYQNPKVVKNKIYIVYRTSSGYEKMGFDIDKHRVNINDNYNDDFKEISNKIIKGLNNKKESNLVLLNGLPGTGKTFFLKFLMSKLKKNVIFISPNMVTAITDPSFIPFLMKNNDSVLVIEDAEPALQKRDVGSPRSDAISNVLNLTDGLLSDCLHISIIATYNITTNNIDDALLRKGRLLMNYKFEKLAKEKSTKLLNKLGYNIEATDDMILADIYNYDKDNNVKITKTKVGF